MSKSHGPSATSGLDRLVISPAGNFFDFFFQLTGFVLTTKPVGCYDSYSLRITSSVTLRAMTPAAPNYRDIRQPHKILLVYQLNLVVI